MPNRPFDLAEHNRYFAAMAEKYSGAKWETHDPVTCACKGNFRISLPRKPRDPSTSQLLTEDEELTLETKFGESQPRT